VTVTENKTNSNKLSTNTNCVYYFVIMLTEAIPYSCNSLTMISLVTDPVE